MNWRHTFGDFDVYANFNIGDSKTKVTKWDNDSKLLSTYYTGKTYGDIFGFETDRYFEEKDFTAKMQTLMELCKRHCKPGRTGIR